MQKKHLIEAIMFLTYAIFAMIWVTGSLLAVDISGHFGVQGVAAATWATNAITLAKIVGNLVAAWFLVQLKPKKAFAFAVVLICGAALAVLVNNYTMYVVTRLIMGLGGALVIVYFGPVVLNYFTAEERPLINGINSIAFNTGNLLALLFTTSLLGVFGSWQGVILFLSGICAVLLVLWLMVSDDFALSAPAKAGDTPQKAYTMSDGFKDPVNWLLPITYCGLLFLYIAVFALFPLMPSFAVPTKNLSVLMISAGMVGTFAGITIAKKYPFRIPVIRYSGLLMTLCAALMIATNNSVLAYMAAFLAGFFMFLPMTCLLTLPQELPDMTPGRVTVIFGMFWSISYFVETILMFMAGMLADWTGDKTTAAMFAVACSASFFITSFFLPETGKKPQV